MKAIHLTPILCIADICLWAFMASNIAGGAAGPELITIAASYGAGGSPINGVSIGSGISYPTINDWGEIAFRAEEYIRPPGIHIPTAWSVSASGEIRKIVQRGMSAPGVESMNFDTFAYLSSNGPDQVTFFGVLDDGDRNILTGQFGLWSANSQGELRLVALSDRLGIGLNPFYRRESGFAVGNFGQVAFMGANFDAQGNVVPEYGILVEDTLHQLQMVALNYAPVDGYNDGTIYLSIRPYAIEVTKQGHVSFLADYSGPNSIGSKGLWRINTDSTTQLVIETGDPLPGVESTVYLHTLENFNMNSRGDAVIYGISRESPEPISAVLNGGYWLAEKSGRKTLLAIKDAPVPELDFARFSELPFSEEKEVLINSSGEVAFQAKFYGPGITEANDTALWLRRSDGILRIVAREGDLAPNGKTFGDFLSDHSSFSLSNSGQIVFTQGGGGSLWAVNRRNEIILIADIGQQIDVNDGLAVDIRTIETIHLLTGTGGEDGGRRSINDRGQIVFVAGTGRFSSAVFLSNAIAIPEPTSNVVYFGFLLSVSLVPRGWLSKN